MSVYRCTLNQAFLNQLYQNVIYLNDPSNAQTPAQIADEIRLNWIGPIRPHQAHGLVYTGVTISQVGTANPPAPVTIPYVNVDGDGTNTLHVGAVCFLLQFRTAFGGRKHRGRYYMASVPWAYTTSDLLNSSGTTSMQNIATALQNRFATGGAGPLKLVIWHRSDSTFDEVKTVTFSPRYALQRRRNIGVGA